MLLRNVALLLLCTSVAMCATLGHYLVKTKVVEVEKTVEEDAPVLNSAAVSDAVVEAASVDAAEEDVAAAAVEPEDDAPAAEEAEEILAVDQPVADNNEVDVLLADGATAEEPGADGDVLAGDIHAVEALTEEVVTQEQPHLGDDTAVEALAEEALTQEQPPSGDDTAVEALAEEALTQEQPPSGDDTAVEALAEEVVTQEQPPLGDDTAVEALAEEVVTQEQPPLGDDIAVEALAEEALTQEQPPSGDDTAVEALAEEAFAEEALTQEQPPSRDIPAVEALAEEALTQEQPPPEEEGNEITPVQTKPSLDRPSANEDKSSWGFNSLRSSFQTVHGYFDSLVELVGGRDGVCQYRCRHGDTPQPRAGYQIPEPNGCSSSLVGFQLDLGVPAMTKCCDQLDMCYDTCGTSKSDCDALFRSCLLDICSDLRKSLGFVSQVQACDSMADVLHNTVGTLGCRPYMNSQRAACVCVDEERDEL
ncbi:group XIIB secretory phospholipase A2-like protein isoform X2 [Pleuronectes platessa]|uniref:group XIIB secretory phospholipase A2-like protein isoform X2 n=1 Tax=Pleuronectes platessa TaxID=8262 RepID=UPI00232A4D88|nr:group XIIB secretory phospholipase A2-like protein isoform X2 [Pleuronectes platessa]